ncbi:MAG: hypothetical protein ACKOD2_18925 [Ilumatobacteraceae bacterium]
MTDRSRLSTLAAELSVMADGTDRYYERVRDMGAATLGEELADLLAAIHEAERSLRTAQRALARAARIAG